MSHLSNEFLNTCKLTLVSKKIDLINRVKSRRQEFKNWDYGADHLDRAADLVSSRRFAAEEKHLLHLVREINHALSKLSNSTFGICEETEEPIEKVRLELVPWARFTVEGEKIWADRCLREIVNGNQNYKKLGGAA